MLGSLILYFKGRRLMMFQLSGFYCRSVGFRGGGLSALKGCIITVLVLLMDKILHYPL